MAITKYLIPFDKLSETHRLNMEDYNGFLNQSFPLTIHGDRYSISRNDFASADRSMRAYLLSDVAMELLAERVQNYLNLSLDQQPESKIVRLIQDYGAQILNRDFGIEYDDQMDSQDFDYDEPVYSVETGTYMNVLCKIPEKYTQDGYTLCCIEGDKLLTRARPVDLVKKY